MNIDLNDYDDMPLPMESFGVDYERRLIDIKGEITNETACLFKSSLIELLSDEPDKDITMHINSEGGQVDAVIAIYELMKHVQKNYCKIKTYAYGLAWSGASLLLMAGHKGTRGMSPNTTIMIHCIQAGTGYGPFKNQQVPYFKYLGQRQKLFEDLYKNEILDTIQNRQGKDGMFASDALEGIFNKFNDAMTLDTWFDAKNAVKYMIVDKISDMDLMIPVSNNNKKNEKKRDK